MWLVAASLLTTFDVEPVKNEKGQYILPEEIYTSAITR